MAPTKVGLAGESERPDRHGSMIGTSPIDGQHKVLLVEDDPSDAFLIQRILRSELAVDAEIDHVETLDEALRRLRAHSYEFILSDLSLPDAEGLDSVEQLAQAAPETVLIVLSGTNDEDVALRAVQLGAQDYLVKERIDQFALGRSVRYALERKRAEQRLAHLAHFDQLTGLANRRTFRDRLAHALARARRNPTAFAVMFLDLDRFKPINDTLGHERGDRVLQEVAARLTDALRDSDTVARLGGDEFAVIIEEVDEPQLIPLLCNRILDKIRIPFELDGHVVSISASIGVASYPQSGQTSVGVLRAADEAMYRAKRAGRGTFRESAKSSGEHALPRAILEEELRNAAKRDTFELDYQPQVDLASQRVLGFEALLRFRPDGRTPVLPQQFIPVLEDTGLITQVGEQVLRKACRQLRLWREDGMPSLRMAVNLSARQLEDDSILGVIDRALAVNGLPPGALEVEVTESTLMQDVARCSQVLSKVRARGVRVSIDDFGTGYSSLAHLHRFNVDTLKIDGSFINTMGQDADCSAIASAVVALGRRLGLDVVAEGIETYAQLEELRRHGCQIGQGYLLARPAAAWSSSDVIDIARHRRGEPNHTRAPANDGLHKAAS